VPDAGTVTFTLFRADDLLCAAALHSSGPVAVVLDGAGGGTASTTFAPPNARYVPVDREAGRAPTAWARPAAA
jgi:hypothetical protein